jgi:hypothetical protein
LNRGLNTSCGSQHGALSCKKIVANFLQDL